MTLIAGSRSASPIGGLDLVGHRRDDGVELVGAVQRDGGDRTGRRVQQCFESGVAWELT